jgi:hypothetical protein
VSPQDQTGNGNVVPAWTGEWSAGGGFTSPGGVTVDFYSQGIPPHFLELVGVGLNASFASTLGLQSDPSDPQPLAFNANLFIPRSSNATYGYGGELLGLLTGPGTPGGTGPPSVVGAFDFKLDDPGNGALPTQFYGYLKFTGSGQGAPSGTVTLTNMMFQGEVPTLPGGLVNNQGNYPRQPPYNDYSIAPITYTKLISVQAGGAPETVSVFPAPLVFTTLPPPADYTDTMGSGGAIDPQGTDLTVQSVSAQQGATSNLSQDGSVVKVGIAHSGDLIYTPPPAGTAFTQDSFVYTVVNELGITAVGTVLVDITPANKPGSSGGQGSSGGATQNPGSGSTNDTLPPANTPEDEIRARAVLDLTYRIQAIDTQILSLGPINSVSVALKDEMKIGKLNRQAKNLEKLAKGLLRKAASDDPAIRFAISKLVYSTKIVHVDYDSLLSDLKNVISGIGN